MTGGFSFVDRPLEWKPIKNEKPVHRQKEPDEVKESIVGDRPLIKSITKCVDCPYRLSHDANPIDVSGHGKRHIMVVVDRPSKTKEGYVWFGEDNPILDVYHAFDKMREKVPETPPFSFKDDIVVAGVLSCPVKASLPYEQCLAQLANKIKQYDPYVIIAVGAVATGAVLRVYNPLHFQPNFSTGHYFGRSIPLTMDGWHRWLVSVPGEAELTEYKNVEVRSVAVGVWLKRLIANAYAIENLKEAGYTTVKPYTQPDIKMVSGPEEIIRYIHEALDSEYIAFDYETNTLDPEVEGGKILTASIAWGDHDLEPKGTAAFYLNDPNVIAEWCKMLRSDTKKIGANIKFEERWSLVNLKTPVNNWYWDICVGARALDCQPGTAGLKYQTFVNFGVIGYDDDVKDYIDDSGQGFNQLDRIPPTKILLYNGLDSYFTYKCAKVQHNYLGLSF